MTRRLIFRDRPRSLAPWPEPERDPDAEAAAPGEDGSTYASASLMPEPPHVPEDAPHLAVSCAMSLDGCMDDVRRERRMLSSEEDMEEVYRFRTGFDMIVVGAETVRRDNCSLATRDPALRALREREGRAPHPIKVVVTNSMSVDPDSRFFTDGDAEKILFVPRGRETGGDAQRFRRMEGVSVEPCPYERHIGASLLCLAESRGAERVLVEGGATLIAQVVSQDVVSHWRLAMAPVVLGLAGRSRAQDYIAHWSPERGFTLDSVKMLGGTAVMELSRKRGPGGWAMESDG